MKKILRIILYIVIILSAIHCLLNIYWGNKLHSALENYRKSELYTPKNKLIPYNLPDKDNAALEFKYIFKIMTDDEGGKQFDWDGSYQYENHFRSLLELYTKENIEDCKIDNPELAQLLDSISTKDITHYIRKAAAKSYLNFYLNYEEGPKMLLPHLAIIRDIYRILNSRTILIAQQGDIKGAYNLLIDGLKSANLLKNEPVMITQLVRIAVETQILRTINFLYARYGVDNDSGYEIIRILEQNNEITPFLRMIDAEKILFGSFIFEGLINGELSLRDLSKAIDIRINPVFNCLPMLFYQPFLKMDYIHYLGKLNGFKNILTIPYWKVPESAIARLPSGSGDYFPLSGMLLPDLSNLLDKITDYRNEINKTILTTAVYLYKDKMGYFPDSISNVYKVINIYIPANLFTGNPFIYTIAAGQFSIGD